MSFCNFQKRERKLVNPMRRETGPLIFVTRVNERKRACVPFVRACEEIGIEPCPNWLKPWARAKKWSGRRTWHLISSKNFVKGLSWKKRIGPFEFSTCPILPASPNHVTLQSTQIYRLDITQSRCLRKLFWNRMSFSHWFYSTFAAAKCTWIGSWTCVGAWSLYFQNRARITCCKRIEFEYWGSRSFCKKNFRSTWSVLTNNDFGS